LRGFAVLAVVLFHFAPDLLPGGFLGVDVFFVLSGFLITSLLVSERESNGRISLRNFWLRRARRLLPALLLVLGAVGVYALLFATEAEGDRIATDGLSALGYFANWRFIVSGQAYVERLVIEAPSPLRHTWSLAIEEQFYLLWPVIVVGLGALVARTVSARARRQARQRRAFRYSLAALCIALGAVSLYLMTALLTPRDPNRVYYGTDTRAFLLLTGAALGALTAGRLTIARQSTRAALILLGCVTTIGLIVAMAVIDASDTWLYRGGYGVISIAVVATLAAAAQPGGNPLRRIFVWRPLVALGLISYGVYLWHWPIVVWITESRIGFGGVGLFAVRAILTLVASIASFVLIEQPIRQRRLARWRPPVRRLAVIGTIGATAAVLAVPAIAFSSIVETPLVKPSNASAAVTASYADAPHCDEPLTTLAPEEAGVPPLPHLANERPRVQLVGNSVAVELVPCLAQLVERGGGALETVAHSAAPPCTLLPELREQASNPATRPDVAIWFAFDWYYDETTCNTDWLIQVRTAIDIWKEAGAHIYLVPIIPNVVPSGDPAVYKVRGEVTVNAPAQRPEFEAFAAADPDITVIDAGVFLRDSKGSYQWRMPCLPGGEPGCADDGAISVRFRDGFHLCSNPRWGGTHCAPQWAGGDRRAASAIALQIEELDLSRTAEPRGS
jgi:peptidoglycan/LPS O-acetylase OafA/YrhL